MSLSSKIAVPVNCSPVMVISKVILSLCAQFPVGARQMIAFRNIHRPASGDHTQESSFFSYGANLGNGFILVIKR